MAGKGKRRNIGITLGLAGVAPDETPQARRAAQFFELPLILVAVWILIDWYLEARNIYPHFFGLLTDWIVWLVFTIELVTMLVLVRDRWRYLRTNWLSVVIVVTGMSVLWGRESYFGALRMLRLLLIVPILVNLSGTVRRILTQNHLGATLLLVSLFTLMSGLLVAGIDPAFEDAWDGIWWAWVTVSTVGYGDLVPETPAGRVFGAILILVGVGFFSLITANFAAFFVSQEEEEVKEREEILEEEERTLLMRVTEIEQRLARVEWLMERVERHLEKQASDPGEGKTD